MCPQLNPRCKNKEITNNSFRFTLEKYVSDYCNIKTNTGKTQHFPFLEFQILLYLISKQAQAFRYLISSSISANNALLRLLVKKAKVGFKFSKRLNFTKGI